MHHANTRFSSLAYVPSATDWGVLSRPTCPAGAAGRAAMNLASICRSELEVRTVMTWFVSEDARVLPAGP